MPPTRRAGVDREIKCMRSVQRLHSSGRNKSGKRGGRCETRWGSAATEGPREGVRQTEVKCRRNGRTVLTPFMIGINDAGSVDIDASSRKTTGKSMTRSAAEADVMHVVHIYNRRQSVWTGMQKMKVKSIPHLLERRCHAAFPVEWRTTCSSTNPLVSPTQYLPSLT